MNRVQKIDSIERLRKKNSSCKIRDETGHKESEEVLNILKLTKDQIYYFVMEIKPNNEEEFRDVTLLKFHLLKKITKMFLACGLFRNS